MARTVEQHVVGVGEEDAGAQKAKSQSYDLKHHARPWPPPTCLHVTACGPGASTKPCNRRRFRNRCATFLQRKVMDSGDAGAASRLNCASASRVSPMVNRIPPPTAAATPSGIGAAAHRNRACPQQDCGRPRGLRSEGADDVREGKAADAGAVRRACRPGGLSQIHHKRRSVDSCAAAMVSTCAACGAERSPAAPERWRGCRARIGHPLRDASLRDRSGVGT